MGGILALEGGAHDYDAVKQVALTVCRVWERYCTQYGFIVKISPSKLKSCCENGGELLERFFPKPPGPFKRVGALVVMSQLDPFFYFEPLLNADQTQRWLPKISALLIPTTLAKLRVNLTPDQANPTWQRLDAWQGFPSPHFKMEFLQYLEGMDNYNWVDRLLVDNVHLECFRDRLITDKAARKIAATGLIIEACYYWNEGANSKIRGKCNDFFNVEDVNFAREFHYDRQIYRGSSGRE